MTTFDICSISTTGCTGHCIELVGSFTKNKWNLKLDSYSRQLDTKYIIVEYIIMLLTIIWIIPKDANSLLINIVQIQSLYIQKISYIIEENNREKNTATLKSFLYSETLK